MENNAAPRRENDGSALRAAAGGEMGDAGGAKATAEKCKNSEAPLNTLVGDSCNKSTTHVGAPAAVNVNSSAGKSQVPEVAEVPHHVQDGQPRTAERCEDRVNDGMGQGSVLGAGDSAEAGASKLVGGRSDGALSVLAQGTSGAKTEGFSCAESEAPTRDTPWHLCTNSSIGENLKTGLEHTSSEGLASGSEPEPEPSLGGESRSIDSLESFSNLNSCPSSDLNSEGPEDRGLALALQSEDGPEDPKPACAKDRAAGQSIYHIKWIKWREENTPIITQNENGPCPLLAIMNVLLLAWKVEMGADQCKPSSSPCSLALTPGGLAMTTTRRTDSRRLTMTRPGFALVWLLLVSCRCVIGCVSAAGEDAPHDGNNHR